MKRRTFMRTAGAVSAGTVRCGPRPVPPLPKAPDKVVLLLNWYTYGEHAPFFLGKEAGIYAAEGIDLDIQEGRGSAVTVQAVAAKTVPFGYADVPTMIRAAAKGAPVTSPGVLLQTSPMSVMGFTDKNIRKPDDLKGKTVATTPGDSMSQIWPLFLKKTGLKESDLKIVAGRCANQAQRRDKRPGRRAARLLDGPEHEDQGRHRQIGVPDHVRRLRHPSRLVGHHRPSRHAEGQSRSRPPLHERLDQGDRSRDQDPKAARDATLKLNPKAGKPDTLLEGFELTVPLYTTPETRTKRPFQVTDANMADSVALLVEYGGVDAAAKDQVKSYYTRDFLPK